MLNIDIQKINNFSIDIQEYQERDLNLINTLLEDTTFNSNTDFIEAKVYDGSKNKIYPNVSFGNKFTNYSIIENDISLNIGDFFNQLGYTTGNYFILLDFFRKICSDNNETLPDYYISEIDSSRTEIRLKFFNNVTTDTLLSINNFINYRDSSSYFVDFYLILKDNRLLCNNIILDQDGEEYSLLIKLYNPLPSEYELKDQGFLATNLNDTLGYKIEFFQVYENVNNNISLQGPNLNLDIHNYSSVDSTEMSLIDIIKQTPNDINNQLSSLINNPEFKLNIDYTEFSNFIHFSSAHKRVSNFINKLDLIQKNEEMVQLGDDENTNINPLKAIIEDTIKSFDGYEYWLYYDKNELSFPKDGNGKPLPLFLNNTINPLIEDWMNEIDSKSLKYDENNLDNLYWNIPEYLREDRNNDPYRIFVEMIGHSFDDIWVYIKGINNLYKGDNRINVGVSKDLLTKLLNQFGINLYSGSYSNQDLYSAFLGVNLNSSNLPYINMTTSFPPEQGEEYVSTYISMPEGELPLNDIEYKIYKRLYHNLPFILKSKGTINALRTIINIYGVPNDILVINEHGGQPKIEIQSPNIPDNVLSNLISLDQVPYNDTLSNEFNKYVEIGFTPQNQLDEKIKEVFRELSGEDFDVSNYISDPRTYNSGGNNYPDLVDLRDTYLNYIINNYNLRDFVRLVKFYNNSLFKLLKDFVPANTTISTGIIFKPTIVERNKLNPLHIDVAFLEFEALMKSGVRNYNKWEPNYASDDRNNGSTVQVTSGGTGGVVEEYNTLNSSPFRTGSNSTQLTQSWEEVHNTEIGLVTLTRDDQREFYNGEFANSEIVFKNPEICRAYFSNEDIPSLQFTVTFADPLIVAENDFITTGVQNQGVIQLWVTPSAPNYPKYMKISAKDFNGISIGGFINSNNLLNLHLEYALLYNPNGLPIQEVEGNYIFYFSNVVPIIGSNGNIDGYLVILNPAESDPVMGYWASSGTPGQNYTLSVQGNYIWQATASGIDPLPTRATGITASNPQGYFPRSGNFPKEQFFRGWSTTNFYQNGIYIPSGPPKIGNMAGNFIGGTKESDRDIYNSIENNSPVVNYPNNYSASQGAWFMDAQPSFFEIPSSSFVVSSSASFTSNPNSGIITFLGIEFTPIDASFYTNNLLVYTYFPQDNDTLSFNTRARLEISMSGNWQTPSGYNETYLFQGNGNKFDNTHNFMNDGFAVNFYGNPTSNMKLALKVRDLNMNTIVGQNDIIVDVNPNSPSQVFSGPGYIKEGPYYYLSPLIKYMIVSASMSSPQTGGQLNPTYTYQLQNYNCSSQCSDPGCYSSGDTQCFGSDVFNFALLTGVNTGLIKINSINNPNDWSMAYNSNNNPVPLNTPFAINTNLSLSASTFVGVSGQVPPTSISSNCIWNMSYSNNNGATWTNFQLNTYVY